MERNMRPQYTTGFIPGFEALVRKSRQREAKDSRHGVAWIEKMGEEKFETVQSALRAGKELAEQGFIVEVVDLRTDDLEVIFTA